MSLFSYVGNALYRADPDLYWEVYRIFDSRVSGEMSAYSRFIQPYLSTPVRNVSEKINDAYLTIQGTPGVASYGLVVDLAVAYVESLS